MANTYTNKLKLAKPEAGDIGWQDEFYRNSHLMDALTFQKMVNDAIIDGGTLSNPVGLNIDVSAVTCDINDTIKYNAGGTVALTDDSVNFIYVDSAGALQKAAEITASRFALIGIADCAGGAIQRYTNLKVLRKPIVSVQGDEPILGYIQGFDMDSPGTANLLRINPGACLDSTGKVEIKLTSALTKYNNSAWVEGDGNGGNGDALGSCAAVYIIMKNDGSVDAMLTSPNTDPSTTLPAGYSWYRFVGIAATGAVPSTDKPGFFDKIVKNITLTSWDVWESVSLTTILPIKYVTSCLMFATNDTGYPIATVFFSNKDMTGKIPVAPTADFGDGRLITYWPDPEIGSPSYLNQSSYGHTLRFKFKRDGVLWIASQESQAIFNVSLQMREIEYVR